MITTVSAAARRGYQMVWRLTSISIDQEMFKPATMSFREEFPVEGSVVLFSKACSFNLVYNFYILARLLLGFTH